MVPSPGSISLTTSNVPASLLCPCFARTCTQHSAGAAVLVEMRGGTRESGPEHRQIRYDDAKIPNGGTNGSAAG